ncbi:uncharacterized protein LOC122502812 [Leptopilina heterotoma]|uniref:uncharacterized protein LOC122502812 n=1 Tax=Leptopilina heterotoma TaxID=63436 RepID=UPI001CA91FAD|nr:uncharacterized protein LOC122502812 [Leptopilina heterotoma]
MFVITNKESEVRQLKDLWKTLKSSYYAERAKINKYKPSGSEASEEPRSSWPYFKIMDNVLKNYPLHNQTVSNFKFSKVTPLPTASDSENEAEDQVVVLSDSEKSEEETTHDYFPSEMNSQAEKIQRENDFFLAIRDCWRRIPEIKRKDGYIKIKAIIDQKIRKRD